ncbi:MAG TPA: class 1 fructose-bisphosphatase [Acidobacteriaceae bacterium]|jgi:fructose-1,6-bisphosphatase I|nr:class 1 fructose-bisphosphatase [Acidobacteriaceae bacterium]
MTSRITVEEHVHHQNGSELAGVFREIAFAAHKIADKIRLAGLGDIYGSAGATNVQGEQQQKLDVVANDVFTAALRHCGCVAAVVSEEDDEPITFDRPDARFLLSFDPLDGSSNIDVNVNVGTIFGVHEIQHSGGANDLAAAELQPGSQQIAAGYVLYGPSTVMVITTGSGVASFTLDSTGDFIRTADNLRMPEQGLYYSTNEANEASWPKPYRDFIAHLLDGNLGGKPYSARYIGSLVADFHRTLLKGGIFLYPPTEKAPEGKLRLLYEANPLAMIAEQSGGAATDGSTRILDLQPQQIHQRTPLAVGSRREVEALRTLVQGAR